MQSPSLSGSFPVGADQHRLRLRCFGEGSPAIVLEAGSDSSGLQEFPPEFIRPLAEHTTTCVYDRVGTGSSAPPTEERRPLEDVATDLHQLLDVAGVAKPHIVVGTSGGGLIAVTYAQMHPASVTALGLLDVPPPNPNLQEELSGAEGWTNPENIDWVAAERELAELEMPIGEYPVLIVTATEGEGGEEQQSFWLDLSPRAEQVVVEGGHDVFLDDPEGVARHLLESLAGA